MSRTIAAVLLSLLLSGCMASQGGDLQRWRLDMTERINDQEDRIYALEEAAYGDEADTPETTQARAD